MLPGFNHNIRYKEKVFHVQTEDNGLDDPDLVTQVFLAGQIVAIERSSYGEILVEGLEERARDQQIRLRMQDQHKRLLKNLVLGTYDAKIALYGKSTVGGTSRLEKRATPVPATIETKAPPEQAALSDGQADDLTPDALLAPGAELAAVDVLDVSHQPPAHLPTPAPTSLIDDLRVSADVLGPIDTSDLKVDIDDRFVSDEDLLRVIEEEMQRQLPWSPKEPAPTPEMLGELVGEVPVPSPAPDRDQDVLSASTPSELPTQPPKKEARKDSSKPRVIRETYRAPSQAQKPSPDAITQRVAASDVTAALVSADAAETKLGRRPDERRASNPPGAAGVNAPRGGKPPPPGDTLIDFHIPAALRREIDDEIARRGTGADASLDDKNGPWRVREMDGREADPDAALRVTGSSMSPKPDGRYSRVRPRADRPFEAGTDIDLNLNHATEPAASHRPPAAEVEPSTIFNATTPVADRPPSRPPSMVRGGGVPVTEAVTPLAERPPPRTPSRAPAVAAPPRPSSNRQVIERRRTNPPEAPNAPTEPASSERATLLDHPAVTEAQVKAAEDAKRPSILVVERSLDEVILSYLYDEMSEK
jgi:hypothetical protein